MIAGIALGVITWLSFQSAILAVVYVAEFLFIAIKRPYLNRNWRPILNMLITVAVLALYYLMNSMEGFIQDYGPLIILALLVVCLVYSSILLVY